MCEGRALCICGNRWLCLVCMKYFPCESVMYVHLAAVHNLPYLYNCSICGFAHSDRDRVLRHIRRGHTDLEIAPKRAGKYVTKTESKVYDHLIFDIDSIEDEM